MSEKPHTHADVIAPPPLIYAAALLLSFILQRIFPPNGRPPKAVRLVGLVLMGLSFTLGFSAVKTMRRACTCVRPDTPTTAIVTTGPFRYTRNPIYLSFNLLYIGMALLANLLWSFLLFPFVVIIMNRGVIAREEHYLTQKVGNEYTQYLTRVRRWF